ncbi:response regulator [Microbacterium sp. IEGM 1404]|uniref:response regulator n=1 Tax=Microbacterium sp. IEGM 1404 TaxID=3047084 RepID=UPI0024B863BE|nr:response regulator transcription factor [Microbacterium sp. IEGM 1404]MDI9892380.1 response regulator transcription factor [Microbacterium sp. IEGM 1404]
MGRIRVLVVDDESLLRRALSVFVSEADDIEVVGTAADGEEALAQIAALAPDVVMMDAQMPRMDGVTATGVITRDHPGIQVLALTTFGSLDTIVPMLQAGAGGYLLKDSEPDDIIAGIRDVHRGLRVLSPAVAGALVSSLTPATEGRTVRLTAAERLTPREAAVVELLARGLSNAEIARQQSVTEATVKSHLSNVMAKWNVRDRIQVLIRAVQAGLVSLD